jgi:hypothetical protein
VDTATLTAPAATAPNGQQPGVVFAHRYAWVEYPWIDPDDEGLVDPDDRAFLPNPDYKGFRVQVLTNPTGAEEIAERQARMATLAGARADRAPDDASATEKIRAFVEFVAAQERKDELEGRYLQAIAYRVRAWNALSADEEGNVVPIPAPGEAPDNWQAFRAIPSDLLAWVCETVRTIHLPKPMPIRSSSPAGTTAAPTPLRTREGPPEPESE